MAKKLTERKREDIIRAAKDEFRDNGFGGTSMDRIAKVAGVSKRTVYNHFDSKETLFKAVAQDMCNIFQRISEYPYAPSAPIREQLQTIATRQMEFLCSERTLRLFKMLTVEVLAAPELTRPILENLEKENVGLIKWIKAASNDGKLEVVNPVWAGKQFMALLEAFTSWPYLYGLEHVRDQAQQQAVVDSAVDIFLDHYATGA
ncbi:MAG: TetR/AcrR family transcriptional regulator [Lysobacterales bacterium]|jgi:TetR/AcrR family transcriptional regulator of autoinduction and epiphytic fitness